VKTGTLRLAITIDTELDNQWDVAPTAPTFRNTQELAPLHEAIRGAGFLPTYLVTYSVARDEPSRALLRSWLEAGECEVGAHLHAWETPPLWNDQPHIHSYIYEYPTEVRREKLRVLTEQLRASFGVAPRSYRAGRWGVDATEIAHLAELGYRVDTSVVPGVSFRRSLGRRQPGPSFAPLLGRRIAQFPLDAASEQQRLREVPVSTAPLGALHSPAAARTAATLTWALPTPLARVAAKALKVCGLLSVAWLRPGMFSLPEMQQVADWSLRQGAGPLNLAFHSSEAVLHTSPLTETEEALERFYAGLGGILAYVRDTYGVSDVTLSGATDPGEADGAPAPTG